MKKNIFLFILLFWCTGCMSTIHSNMVGSNSSQLALRSYQTRTFENEDISFVIKNIILTMQDLDFIIDKVDNDLSIISGTSFKNGSKLTATARQSDNNVIVRINAQANSESINNPIVYQNFFNALSQSIFLSKNM